MFNVSYHGPSTIPFAIDPAVAKVAIGTKWFMAGEL
jgi:hypothetical protein